MFSIPFLQCLSPMWIKIFRLASRPSLDLYVLFFQSKETEGLARFVVRANKLLTLGAFVASFQG